ncbi:MAG: hypothetical protein Q4P09_07675, partial [Phascolarctobacterium sp.]|nr:hypothetical protein [Phascolarctobacterium sp.]
MTFVIKYIIKKYKGVLIMSKSRKSRVLASLLCATTLAGIYAAPVLAGGNVTVPGSYSNSGNMQVNDHDISKITIAGVAINAGNISSVNTITANGLITANSGLSSKKT